MNREQKKKAMEAYEDAVKLVGNMFDAVAESVHFAYGKRGALERFDVLLQYSLMQVALNDGYFHIEEAKFIRDIAQYCDFCDFLRKHGFDDLTWQEIYDSDERRWKRVLDDARDDVISLSNDFVAIFATVDAVTASHSYIDDFYNYMLAIISAIVVADGNYDEEEIFGGCLILDRIESIKKLKKENEKTHQKQPKAQKRTTLKDKFVKKN